MGLFDTIYFEIPPIKENKELQYFQTKCFVDIGGSLDNYKITKEGNLQKEEYDLRDAKPEEQTTIKGIKLPLFVKYNCRWINSNYTGEIICYDLDDKFWYNLYLNLEDGEVKNIEIEKTER